MVHLRGIWVLFTYTQKMQSDQSESALGTERHQVWKHPKCPCFPPVHIYRTLKCASFFVCVSLHVHMTGYRKRQQTPLSLSTRQVWRFGCWLVTRWRRRPQLAMPASCFTATPRSWSWLPNALRSRAFTMSCLTWVGLSWGSTEAWPGTPSLGVCVFLWEIVIDY